MKSELDELLKYATQYNFSPVLTILQYNSYLELDRVSGGNLAFNRTKKYIDTMVKDWVIQSG